MPIGGMIPAQAAAAIFGIEMEKGQNRRQIQQQGKLQAMQIRGSKELTDYQKMKELEIWKETSYPAQMAMMKEAGLNPSLMYGMGGGGGVTVGGSGAGVSGGSATGASAQGLGAMGMGLQMRAQTELLQAQKENIEADTANKQAETTYTGGAKTKQAESSSKLMDNQAWEVGLRAALEDVLQQTNEKGEYIGGGTTQSVAAKDKIAELLVKNSTMQKIGQEITLMKAKGLTEGQVYENLKKDGQLKDTEIEWNALDLQGDNAGKFLTNLIKWLFKR